MSTRILGIADPHLHVVRPRSRKDPDWKGTQRLKFEKLFNLAEKLKLPNSDRVGCDAIAIAGDIFHQPDGRIITRRLETWLIPILRKSPCPIYVIPGNHDMRGYREDSLEDHPYGILRSLELVKQTTWPNYVVVGSDPLVIVTGREFESEGPRKWLQFLTDSREIHRLKDELKTSTGKEVFCYGMTHCWWGPSDTMNRGEPVVGHDAIKGTGIDVMIYGHPHTLDGVTEIPDEDGLHYVVGPGSFIRGTIAEHDTQREPKILVTNFNSDGGHQLRLVTVPHKPAEEVFDFEKHIRVKREATVRTQFINSISEIGSQGKSLETIMSEASSKGVNAMVLKLANELLTKAEESFA